MPSQIQSVISEAVKKFDLFWGYSPDGSAKHKRGQEVKSFISSLFSDQALIKGERRRIIAQLKDEVLSTYKAELIKEIEGMKLEENHVTNCNFMRPGCDCGYENKRSYNSALTAVQEKLKKCLLIL